ncbi:UDP-3-O-(3-hydroxymyristoyl)glucosamine N-acyltransferase [Hippea jasoniae]|uniref:UDP-3-O-(3-hydroxymyristoyl)glucosamine N-acyltransferase n=1 Tax=Hippea jasoniae TaxID=944479 RepID=UPI000554B5C1|nr:UDP-3-O-(3-hydroxymyristoyl)glucosamine N-acyltransferase [Hippea jasoniae]
MKIEEIAKLLNCSYIKRFEVDIDSLAPIEKAQKNTLSFLSNPKYEKYLKTTKAGCIIAPKSIDPDKYKNLNLVICDDPYLAFAVLLRHFYLPKPPSPKIDKTDIIGENSSIDETAHIEEYVVIGNNVKIGKHTRIMPFVYIGDNVVIKDNCLIYPNVVIRENCVVGNNVIIHAGSVIGSDGFGYAKTQEGRHLKIPQIGNVVIEDDVEIGANVTIDRAALESTIIKKGTKIDNLVQIAHNVEIGENSIIIAQTGISGSTKIGNNVILAGQTGIAGHLKIADNTIITAKSGIGTSIKKAGIYSGIPAYDHNLWLKSSAIMPKLYEMYKKIKELSKTIEELKDAIDRKD